MVIEPKLAGTLALGQVGQRVVLVLLDRTGGLAVKSLNRFLRRIGRNHILALVDEIHSPGLDQGRMECEAIVHPTGCLANTDNEVNSVASPESMNDLSTGLGALNNGWA